MAYRFGLIGYPIKHSLSPWIHKQFLEKANLAGDYHLIELNPNDSMEEKVNALKDSGMNGFNVTVPYKLSIIPYLDEMDENAKIIGAVNTVLNDNGKWIGYNTDGIGYLRSLKNKYPALFKSKARKILIIGAGGAARGIYYALVSDGFERIDIANRSVHHAVEIAKLKGSTTATAILTLEEAEESLSNYDLVIQTSSVGMKPNEGDTIITLKQLKSSCIASDIVYQPLVTKFLQQAKEKGASIHLGHTMLLFQAQYAFEIWTGKLVPIDHMDKQLQLILEGR